MEPLFKASTPAQQQAAISELFDNSSMVLVCCGEHNYYPEKSGIENVGVVPPVLACKNCWEAYFLVYFAKLPPHMRAQRLEELEYAAHHAAEAERRGQADWKLDRHPKIEFGHE